MFMHVGETLWVWGLTFLGGIISQQSRCPSGFFSKVPGTHQEVFKGRHHYYYTDTSHIHPLWVLFPASITQKELLKCSVIWCFNSLQVLFAWVGEGSSLLWLQDWAQGFTQLWGFTGISMVISPCQVCCHCGVRQSLFLMLVVPCSASLLFSIVCLQLLACGLVWFAFYDLMRYWCGSFSSGHQTRRALSAKCFLGPNPIRILLWWLESWKPQLCFSPGFYI